MNRRPGQEQTEVALDWGWAWPMNRRLLYNRASADPDGKPWSERKRYVWWDEDRGTWAGDDVPDFPTTAPSLSSRSRCGWARQGWPATIRSSCKLTGKGWLFARASWSTDRCPRTTSHRRVRSATRSIRSSRADAIVFPRKDNLQPVGGRARLGGLSLCVHDLPADRAPYGWGRGAAGCPFCRVAAGEMFCEISPALAAERGLEPYGWATIISARTAIGHESW